MQRLPVDKMLKFRADTMMELRKQYNLDKPGQMDEAVDILDAWVKKQGHFMKKDFSREYLERIIILLKGSVQRAKSQLDKICTLRTAMPKYFEVSDPQTYLKDVYGYVSQALLPSLTEDNYRIFMTKVSGGPHTQKKICLIYIYCIVLNEYIKSHDYCDGLISITDMRDVNIVDIMTEINLTELQQFATIVMNGYCARVKGIHFLSGSTAIDLLVKIMKQILSAKVANRIHVHKTVEELYEFFPRESLPKDYGGSEKCLDELNDEWLQILSSEENKEYLKMMREARTDESQRQVDTFNEKYLGLAGTFRTLNVD